jgi:hypothetical protein
LKENGDQYKAYANQQHDNSFTCKSLLGNSMSKYNIKVVDVNDPEAAYSWSPIDLMEYYDEWKMVAQADAAQQGHAGGYDDNWIWHNDTRDFTDVNSERVPSGIIYLYNRKHVFNHFVYLDYAIRGVCSKRMIDVIKGFVANGFIDDWKANRFEAESIVNTCLCCLSTGQDFMVNSQGRLLIEVLRKVISINPMLNIYTIARASKEELEQAMVMMLAMSESEELKAHSLSITAGKLLVAFEIMQQMRIDQSINWVVSSGVAVILYEMLVCNILVGYIDVDLSNDEWKDMVSQKSQSLSRAVCLEVATTAVLTTFTLA